MNDKLIEYFLYLVPILGNNSIALNVPSSNPGLVTYQERSSLKGKLFATTTVIPI